MMQSTFISYGGPDEAFAIMLRDELQRNGVSTFLFRDNAPPGEKLHRAMREGVNSYDRVVLVCSRSSLDRPGVLNEIEETLQREARDGGASYLIPIRLDDYVFSGWNPPNRGIAQAVRGRVVGDFRRAKRSRKALSQAIGPLLSVLKRRSQYAQARK
jgi:TIR domain